MLQEGDVVPDFTLKNQKGEDVSLSDMTGKKWVLYAYPKDDTPGCTLEAQDFTRLKADFDAAGVALWGISKDSVGSHEKFCGKYNLSVSLLSDPDAALLTPLGAWGEKKNYGKTYMGIIRSTYLIDGSGRLLKIWRNVRAKGHAEKVLDAVG